MADLQSATIYLKDLRSALNTEVYKTHSARFSQIRHITTFPYLFNLLFHFAKILIFFDIAKLLLEIVDYIPQFSIKSVELKQQ